MKRTAGWRFSPSVLPDAPTLRPDCVRRTVGRRPSSGGFYTRRAGSERACNNYATCCAHVGATLCGRPSHEGGFRFAARLFIAGTPYHIALALLLLLSVSALAQPNAAPKPAAPKRFVVVAPRRFRAALGDYLRHKQRQLPTSFVALEAVLASSPGVDDPEKLKRYLYEAWKSDNLGYVLLVGDVDVMPVRYMVLDRVTPAAFDYAFYPSDLYYSDLATSDGRFDDWNGNKEGFHAGYFGEVRGEKNKRDPINYDHIDYRPDIAVGRWPVSTPEEAQIVATKTITYENGLAAGTKRGMRRAALFSVGGWVDSRGLMDDLANRLAPGWTVERRFYTDKARNDQTPPPTEAQLDRLMNDGVGLICHAGHGSDDSWAECFERAHLGRLYNEDGLPVVISCGCSTARFATLPPYEAYVDVDGKEHAGSNFGEVFTAPPPPPAVYQKGRFNPTGLGEQLLRAGPNGAVAYIGCNTGSQPCGLTLLDGFVRAIAQSDHPLLGDCWAQAVSYYYDHEHLATLAPNDDWYPPSIFFQGMKFMLFGDPTLPLPGRTESASSHASAGK